MGGTGSKRTVIAVCAGDSCADEGSKKLRKRLEELIEERELNDLVRVSKCSCRDLCGKGPVIEVQPHDVIIKKAKPKRAGDVLDEVLTIVKKARKRVDD